MFYVKQKFRYFCYAMMASTVTYCLIFFFLIAFDCKDEYYTWHFSLTASCIEITTLNVANGALNLATDVVIMIMPLPLIWHLQLKRAQKWGLMAIFSTGIFVCASTLVREIIIVKTDKEVDQSWATVGEITWMTVELNVAIICISLPILSPVYTRIMAAKLNMTSLRNLFSLSGRSRSTLNSNKSKSLDSSNKDTSPYNDSVNLVEISSKPYNTKHSPMPGHYVLTFLDHNPTAWSLVLCINLTFAAEKHPRSKAIWAEICDNAVSKMYKTNSVVTLINVSFHISHKGWLATQTLILPLLRQLTESMTSSWLPLLIFDHVWHAGYEPFARMGCDTFLAVSPSRIVMWTCDSDAIDQLFERRNDFEKPVEDMQMLNIHGPTVTGTNGAESRRYRRVTAGAFGSQTYHKVWKESIIATEKILSNLNLKDDSGICLTSPLEETTLDIVSRVCFGRDDSLERGTNLESDDYQDLKTQKKSQKHQLSYNEAFSTSASHMGSIYLVPRLLLKISPFKIHKRAWKSFKEWQWYMEEMVAARKHNRSTQKVTSDLLDALITAGEQNEDRISYQAILGNIWVFILGGFHTSSNTLHFILILLAIFPDIQETLQSSLDASLGDRPPSEWTHAADFPKLVESHLGAVIAETIRVFGVLPFIPKTTGPVAQALTLHERTFTVPANTLILINTSATHRNPKYWPSSSSVPSPDKTKQRTENPLHPVEIWKPWENWLDEASRKLKRPDPGTYISFSSGARECIGKRFAQVEISAILARLLKTHSVELATDGVDNWQNARAQAITQLYDGVGFKMALELTKSVNVLLVPRSAKKDT
ncbi:hypothetical protein BCON_0180g00220 [Botryotinia convoluta]|uniref:Rhodopsin domain-containing protein n=1 Tax=Botryotinia convoluta TaxID=54673 RepID=A0A4Z1HNC0_9HELO|nr:hypothetical protein BCON_0180g00220 [Botryotinia convoluta]